jgi:sulfur-oxidizing protein SoxY
MSITRRKVLGRGLGGISLGAVAGSTTLLGTTLGMSGTSYGSEIDDAIAAFTGGVKPGSGRINLGAPQIAENGNTVPIKISVESAMSEADHVSEVMVLAMGNPAPGVATFKFTPMSGKAAASTRIRLAKTQDLIAIAKMSDGSFYSDTKSVKVTIGGCGG